MPGRDLNSAATMDAYLAEVAARLPGPRRFRARVLDELRDGLCEAAVAHRAASGDAAIRAAIADFGPPARLAAAFIEDAATAQARYTVIGYAVTGPLVGVWWLLTLAPPTHWNPDLDVAALVAALPALPLIAVAGLAIGLTLAATGWMSRRFPASTRRAIELSMVTGIACALADLTMLGTLAAGSPARAGLPTFFAGAAAATSLTRLAMTGRALRRGWCAHAALT
jgi:hypothetical protein